MKQPAGLPMQPREWSSGEIPFLITAECSAHTYLRDRETDLHSSKKKKKKGYFNALLLTYKCNYNLLLLYIFLSIVSFLDS